MSCSSWVIPAGLVVVLLGCGSVTPSSSADAGAGVDQAGELLEAGNTDLQVDQARDREVLEAGNTETSPAPSSSSCAAMVSSAAYAVGASSCAACTNQGVNVEQACIAFVNCVRDDLSDKPVAACHLKFEGTSGAHAVDDCVKALLVAACPTLSP